MLTWLVSIATALVTCLTEGLKANGQEYAISLAGTEWIVILLEESKAQDFVDSMRS